MLGAWLSEHAQELGVGGEDVFSRGKPKRKKDECQVKCWRSNLERNY